MSRNKILISILFFGFPVLLFLGGYYLEFFNKNVPIIETLDDSDNKSYINHTILNNISFSISGKITKRYKSNKLEIAGLKITEKKSGNSFANYSKFTKCIIYLHNKGINIIEYMNFPLNNDSKIKSIKVLEKKIFLNSKNKIKSINKLLLKPINSLKNKIEKYKDEIVMRHKKGFDDIEKKDIKSYMQDFISKLLLCAVYGDELAMDALHDFKSYFSFPMDEEMNKCCNDAAYKAAMACKEKN